MLTRLFEFGEIHKEGDLYKELSIGGNSFRILYGYYEDFEREGHYNEPMPIYPDLLKNPVFTQNGEPISTAIQDVCMHYTGRPESEGDSCSDCIHFKLHEDLFGICSCPLRRKEPDSQTEVQIE